MKKGTLQQILLITDGYSNEGEDPTAVATLAQQSGITVNVIGVLDDGEKQPSGLKEIEEIAHCGGGMSQIVLKETIYQTGQMDTKQAMNQMIKRSVNEEIMKNIGEYREMLDHK